MVRVGTSVPQHACGGQGRTYRSGCLSFHHAGSGDGTPAGRLGEPSWRPCHFFETGSWCVIQAGLHLVVPLPLTAVITGVCHHTQQRECRLLRSIELPLPLDVLIGLSRPSAHTCPLDLTLSFSAHRRGLCCGVRVTSSPWAVCSLWEARGLEEKDVGVFVLCHTQAGSG